MTNNCSFSYIVSAVESEHGANTVCWFCGCCRCYGIAHNSCVGRRPFGFVRALAGLLGRWCLALLGRLALRAFCFVLVLMIDRLTPTRLRWNVRPPTHDACAQVVVRSIQLLAISVQALTVCTMSTQNVYVFRLRLACLLGRLFVVVVVAVVAFHFRPFFFFRPF